MIQEIISVLGDLPPLAVYLVLAAGAAVENVVPPVPADTVVLFGAFLAGVGRANAWLVLAATWGGNVASALAVYGLAYRWGRPFFRTRIGTRLLQPRQLHQVAEFYRRWGPAAIFASRFFPGLRALVPVFAGVTHLPFTRVALPLITASALWYGGLVWLGASVGRNWRTVSTIFDRVSGVLLVVALLVLAAAAVWWWRSRRGDGEPAWEQVERELAEMEEGERRGGG